MATSIFSTVSCMEEWLHASSRAVGKDPHNKLALDLHVALHEVYDLYFSTSITDEHNVLPIHKRHEIFSRFERAALNGYPAAMFFEGLARREGFGCKQDVSTGNALIQVAAIARNCSQALNYLGISYFSTAPEQAVRFFKQAAGNGYAHAYKNLGFAYIYGIGIAQGYFEAIRCFKTAGEIAAAELNSLSVHFKNMRNRILANTASATTSKNAFRLQLLA